MPWTETCVMEERVKFIMDVLDSTYCMTELCTITAKFGWGSYNLFGISSLQREA